MSDIKAEIFGIVMKEYNKVRIRNTLFFETWENSITGGIINHIRKLFHKGPVLCRVVVQLSEEDLLREKGESINVVNLDACKSGSMGVYLAQMLSYDSNRNNAKMRLMSRNPAINNTIIHGSPLCSEKFFAKFWKKHLSKFGDMEDVLMS